MADESQQSTGRILTRDPSPVQVVADRTDDGAYEISVRPSADGAESSAGPSMPSEDVAAATPSSLPWRPAAIVLGAAVVILGIGIAQRSTPPGPEAAAVAPVAPVEEESSFRVYRVDPVQLQPATRFVLGDRIGEDVDAGETPDTFATEDYAPSIEPGAGASEEDEPVDLAPRDWSPPPSGLQRAAQPPALRSPEAQSEAVLRSTMAGQLERVPVQVERILIDFPTDDDEFDDFEGLDEFDDLDEFDEDLP